MTDIHITPNDDANSTSTPLSADGSWAGEWRLIPTGNNLRISSYADVVGRVDIDFRNSDTGEVITEPSLGYSCGPGILEMHIIPPSASYYRVRYENGSSAQTFFELYTTFTPNGDLKLSPYNKRIGRDENALPTRPSDPQDDILRNLRSGVINLNKFAFRSTINIADGDALIIADDTTNTPTILTTASTFDITYNAVTDGLGNNGALSLLFTYIDENEELQEATHVLGSSGSDTTSFTGLGINRTIVLASGSSNRNESDINITATTGGSVQAFIPATTSTTQQMMAHIPINTVAPIKFIRLNAFKLTGGSAPRVTFKLFVYNRAVDTEYEILREKIDTDVENTLNLIDPIGIPLPGRYVFWVTASTNTNGTEASSRVSMNIYDID